MMVVVGALTLLGLFLAERKVAIEAERDLHQDFRNELATLHGVQGARHNALADRCRQLVRRPRIHAALEDNAVDLLYPSARDELRDIIAADRDTWAMLRAKFYRFLDSSGDVISPPPGEEVGMLLPNEQAQLALRGVPATPQLGYLARSGPTGPTVDEIIAMPIVSMETGEVIAALVLGSKPEQLGSGQEDGGIRSGVWLSGGLHLPGVSAAEQTMLAAEVARALQEGNAAEESFEVRVSGVPHLLFYQQLNPGSLYPAAYEVALYPLGDAIARRQEIRRHVILAGAALLVAGLLAGHIVASRLAVGVERLEQASEHDRTERARAEAALQTTSIELQRSARFSADASHQLKTPITVLRAGIDEILSRNDLPKDVYADISALLHQTYRITNVVDDLLLLSRMDAGRLQIRFGAVNLSQLIEEWIDDLSALPDELDVELETNFPPDLHVAGEKRYITLIVQNLLENARKYNIRGGRICVAAEERGDLVVLTVENTGRPIPAAARDHIFERFHRGAIGENVPGHGLGLNLARELARLHGGDLRLVRSDEELTEFEVRLRPAKAPASLTPQPA
jgi:signal transduction histidine kinase